MLRIDRLLERAKARGVSQAHLAELVGRQRYYLADLARKGTQPSAETVEVWADALSTTPAYLLGETDEKEKPTGTVAGGLDKADAEILDIIHHLIILITLYRFISVPHDLYTTYDPVEIKSFKRSAAAESWACRRWVYTSWVVVMDAWPRILCASISPTPAAYRVEAIPWRN